MNRYFKGEVKLVQYWYEVKSSYIVPAHMCHNNLPSTVPSLPPEGLSGNETGSTTIAVQWLHVPECCRHGVIRAYRVSVKDAGTGATVIHEVAGEDTLQVSVTDLKKYYWYELAVLAFTAKGHGPWSGNISVRTGEDGE